MTNRPFDREEVTDPAEALGVSFLLPVPTALRSAPSDTCEDPGPQPHRPDDEDEDKNEFYAG